MQMEGTAICLSVGVIAQLSFEKRRVNTTMKKRKNITHPHFVAVRLTDAEMAVLEQGSSTFKISKSEYLRKLLLDKKIQHTIEVVADMDDIKSLVKEYGKIGSNLNQIAKYFNSGGEHALVIEDEIHQCISDLFVLRKKVLQMAGDNYGHN